MMMMVPEHWTAHESMSAAKKAFYEYHSCLIEPWDGPASLVEDLTCLLYETLRERQSPLLMVARTTRRRASLGAVLDREPNLCWWANIMVLLDFIANFAHNNPIHYCYLPLAFVG
jgi:hypothetical protein